MTRAIVAPVAGKNIFAGQGAVIDTGADMDPITARAPFQFVELGETRRRQRRRVARVGPCAVPQCAARGRELSATRAVASGAPQPEAPVVRDPTNALSPDAQRSDDVLLTRFDAAALVPVLQGRQYLLVHVERASDILQVLGLKREFPGAQDGAGRGDRGLDGRRPDRRRRESR